MEKKSFKNKRNQKENDWSYKEQFQILDEKYSKIKDILKQVLKDLKEEKERKHQLLEENEKISAELKEREDLLEHMQSVSEAVIDEYTALKVKCELETEAATNATKRATKYFQENQKLKKNSPAEAGDSSELQCQDPSLEDTVSELDELNKLSLELRTEIASLKIQLEKEIERQRSLEENFEIVQQLYEHEVSEHSCTKEKLKSSQLLSRNINPIDELDGLENPSLPSPVSQAQSDLARESEDLLNHEGCSPNEHSDLMFRLNLAEDQLDKYKEENNALSKRVQELETLVKKLHVEVSSSELKPIPPPPPPPPPLPPPSFNPIKSLITFIHSGKKAAKVTKEESVESPQQKAMSEMIAAIKQGKVHLKPTPKVAPHCSEIETEESALGEMKNMLSTLKKRSCANKDKVKIEPGSGLVADATFPTSESIAQSIVENDKFDDNIDDELKMLFRKKSLKSYGVDDVKPEDFLANACSEAIIENISSLHNDGVEEVQSIALNYTIEEIHTKADNNTVEDIPSNGDIDTKENILPSFGNDIVEHIPPKVDNDIVEHIPSKAENDIKADIPLNVDDDDVFERIHTSDSGIVVDEITDTLSNTKSSRMS